MNPEKIVCYPYILGVHTTQFYFASIYICLKSKYLIKSCEHSEKD